MTRSLYEEWTREERERDRLLASGGLMAVNTISYHDEWPESPELQERHMEVLERRVAATEKQIELDQLTEKRLSRALDRDFVKLETERIAEERYGKALELDFAKEDRYRKKEEMQGTVLEQQRDQFDLRVEVEGRRQEQLELMLAAEKRRRDAEVRRQENPRSKLLYILAVRQGGKCADASCDTVLPDDSRSVHIDHIIPLNMGGSDDLSNKQALCAECNLRKGASIPE